MNQISTAITREIKEKTSTSYKIPNNKTQHVNDEIMKKHEKFIYLKPLI